MIRLAVLLAVLFWVLESALHYHSFDGGSLRHALFPNEPNELWMRGLVCTLLVAFGLVAHRTIRRMKAVEADRLELQESLHAALTHVLRAFLPICSNCKKIRTEEGQWSPLEQYVREHSETRFTHTLCPTCARTLYPEQYAESAAALPPGQN